MRGKAYLFPAPDGGQRITPAHAGKRAASYGRSIGSGDHPRPCGEKVALLLFSPLILGSPPPMRGKVPEQAQTPAEPGITPAHAGKRGQLMAFEHERKDHPRPCGEKRNRSGA